MKRAKKAPAVPFYGRAAYRYLAVLSLMGTIFGDPNNMPVASANPTTVTPPVTAPHAPVASGRAAGSTLPQASAAPLFQVPAGSALNLGAANKLFVAPNTHPVTITEGNSRVLIVPGTMVSAAVYFALTQTLQGSRQQLIVNAQGTAQGGSLVLNPQELHAPVDVFKLPANVSVAALGFTPDSPFAVSGAATIAGSFYALQTKPGMTSQLNFGSLNVTPTGLISTSTPVTFQVPQAVASQGLNLNVAGDFVNQGTISANNAVLTANVGGNFSNQSVSHSVPMMHADSISIHAAGELHNEGVLSAAHSLELVSNAGFIANSGLIKSEQNNVILNGSANHDFLLQNTGVVSAVNGSIIVRDADFQGSASTTLSGGDLLSRELSVNAGNGTSTINANQVTGRLDVSSAGVMHATTNTDKFVLGDITVKDDPTFFNTGGDIDLSGALNVPQDLAIIASANVVATGACSINTSTSAGNAGNVLIVAGAQQSVSGSQAVSGSNDQTSLVSILGPSSTGGSVQLQSYGTGNISTISATGTGTNGNGGNVSIVAFSSAGPTPSGGVVNLPASSTINTSGAGTGSNGNVLIVSGYNCPQNNRGSGSIYTGNIQSNGATGGGGNVSILAGQAVLTGGNGMVTVQNGTIQPGSATFAVLPGSTGTVDVEGAVAANQLTASAGNNLTFHSWVNANTVALNTTAGSNGSIYIDSRAGSGSTFSATADGTGTINGAAFATNVNLQTDRGIIGSPSSNTPFFTSAGTVSVQTNSLAYIQNQGGPVNLGPSQVSQMTFSTQGGSITTTGAISASQSLALSTMTGDINVNSPITGGYVSLNAWGNIRTQAPISGSTVFLGTQQNSNGSITTNASLSGTNSVTLFASGTGQLNLNGAITSPGGTITAQGGGIAFGSSASLNAGTGSIYIYPTNGYAASVGGGAGFNVPVSALSQMVASSVTIGQNYGAPFTLGASISLPTTGTPGITPGFYNLSFLGGDFSVASTNPSVSTGLDYTINMDNSISNGTGAISSASGTVSLLAGLAASGNGITTGAISANKINIFSGSKTYFFFGDYMPFGGNINLNGNLQAVNDISITSAFGTVNIGTGTRLTCTNGPISITAGTLSLPAGSAINAGSGTVSLIPGLNYQKVAGPSQETTSLGGSASFNVPLAWLNQITASKLIIGDGNNGNFTLGSTVALPATGTPGTTPGLFSLAFNSGGTYTNTSGTILNARAQNVSINALNGVTSGSIIANQVALESDAGSISATTTTAKGISLIAGVNATVSNAGALTVNQSSVGNQMQITTTTASSPITIAGALSSATGLIKIVADGSLVNSAPISGGSVLLQTSGGSLGSITVDSPVTSTVGTVQMNSNRAIVVNAPVTGQSGVVLAATSTIGLNGNLSAGQLADSPSYPMSDSDVAASGAITLTAGIPTLAGNINVTNNVNVTAVGTSTTPGNITFNAYYGAINLGANNSFTAYGGNLKLLTHGSIIGGAGNTFNAYAVGTTTASTGGGIELSAGISSAAGSGLAAAQANGVSGSIPAPGVLGTKVLINNPTPGANISGVVQARRVSGGTINLSSSGTNYANLFLNGGAMVFSAMLYGTTVKLDGATFTVAAYKPVGYSSVVESSTAIAASSFNDVEQGGQELAYVFVPGIKGSRVLKGGAERIAMCEMDLSSGSLFVNPKKPMTVVTAMGKVRIKKGAFAAISIEEDGVRIVACSGPDHVSIEAGGAVIKVAPGEEILLSNRTLSSDACMRADGVGRRAFRSFLVSKELHGAGCEVSIPSILANVQHLHTLLHPSTAAERQILNRLLKTASALQQVTGSRGSYSAISARQDYSNTDSRLRPVAYEAN